MRSRQVVATGIVLVAMGTSLALQRAIAENAMTPVPEKFRILDANRDGFLSRAETKNIRDYTRAFTEADQNHDGKLDADEFVKAEAIHEREQAAAYVDDSIITAKVKAALLKDAQVRSLSVGVETYKGHVLLSGFVEDAKQRDQALRAAAAVRGVVEVKDGLALK